MPALVTILDSSLRLARKAVPSSNPSSSVHDIHSRAISIQNSTFIRNTTITPTRHNAVNINTTFVANGTLVPNYSTGLTGVNLTLDQKFVHSIWISMVTVAFVVLALRLWQLGSNHIRHIYCLHSSRLEQNYWTYNKTWWWPWMKREVIYAPLGTKRHNREIQLSRAANYGTLPGRVHTFLLVSYALSNVVYCLVLPYGGDKGQLIAELRGRTGMLATVNMVPLVLMAARNNPAIALLKISFDTFNLFHRWIGRIVVVEAIIHISAWYTNYSRVNGHIPAVDIFSGNTFLTAGLCAFIAMCFILVQTLSPIRHAFYEIFLHLHIFLAFVGMFGVYVHLELHNLPALPYIRTVVVFWLSERFLRLARLIYLNCSFRNGVTYVTVEALPAEACRVTFQLPRHVIIRPGSHIYAYIPRISWWMSHPFSVAWTNVESEPPTGFMPENDPFLSIEDGDDDSIKEAKKRNSSTRSLIRAPTAISLVVAARTGMTRKLYEEASKGPLRLAGFVEGPYAGHDSLSSYGTVVMFAGGAGITHHLVQIRHLIARAQARTVATRKIVLIWTVRDLDALSWVRPWMDEILNMPGRRDVLSIELYVTKPRGATDYVSPSATVQLFARRCDPGAVLDKVLPMRVGAVMVTICGPGAFADEVRAAVRSRLHIGCMDMNEEAFTW